MKIIIRIGISILLLSGLIQQESMAQHPRTHKYATEATIGPRIPIGITKDDITTGMTITLSFGYKLNRYVELFHVALDFGNSSPHNPNMLVIQDYYSYSGRLAMETVTVIGFPLTSRLHVPINKSLTGYLGGGGAYYWFSSRLEDPVYGSLQEPRSRHGYGAVLETGIFTNFFSDRWLFLLKGDFLMLKTSGKTLSIKEQSDIVSKENRIDKYLNITIGIRYLLN